MSKVIQLAERSRADREQKTDVILSATCIAFILIAATIAAIAAVN